MNKNNNNNKKKQNNQKTTSKPGFTQGLNTNLGLPTVSEKKDQ